MFCPGVTARVVSWARKLVGALLGPLGWGRGLPAPSLAAVPRLL